MGMQNNHLKKLQTIFPSSLINKHISAYNTKDFLGYCFDGSKAPHNLLNYFTLRKVDDLDILSKLLMTHCQFRTDSRIVIKCCIVKKLLEKGIVKECIAYLDEDVDSFIDSNISRVANSDKIEYRIRNKKENNTVKSYVFNNSLQKDLKQDLNNVKCFYLQLKTRVFLYNFKYNESHSSIKTASYLKNTLKNRVWLFMSLVFSKPQNLIYFNFKGLQPYKEIYNLLVSDSFNTKEFDYNFFNVLEKNKNIYFKDKTYFLLLRLHKKYFINKVNRITDCYSRIEINKIQNSIFNTELEELKFVLKKYSSGEIIDNVLVKSKKSSTFEFKNEIISFIRECRKSIVKKPLKSLSYDNNVRKSK